MGRIGMEPVQETRAIVIGAIIRMKTGDPERSIVPNAPGFRAVFQCSIHDCRKIKALAISFSTVLSETPSTAAIRL